MEKRWVRKALIRSDQRIGRQIGIQLVHMRLPFLSKHFINVPFWKTAYPLSFRYLGQFFDENRNGGSWLRYIMSYEGHKSINHRIRWQDGEEEKRREEEGAWMQMGWLSDEHDEFVWSLVGVETHGECEVWDSTGILTALHSAAGSTTARSTNELHGSRKVFISDIICGRG